MAGHDQRHYGGNYKPRARQVRDAANANPATVCWRCGRTLAQVRTAFPKRRVTWDAGHTIDGDPHCPLLAECSPCNRGAGQALTETKRRSSGGTGRI